LDAKIYWTIKRMRDNHIPWKEITEYFSVASVDAVQRAFYKQRQKYGQQPILPRTGIDETAELATPYFDEEAAEVVFVDKKIPEDIDWRELVAHAQAAQDISKRLSDLQPNNFATIRIETTKPIAIMFTADWHLGDANTEYAQWQEDIQFLIETPRLYAADLGDETQNMRTFRDLSAVLSQALTPTQQAQLFRSIIKELAARKKLIVKICGNHDTEFDERIFGESLYKYLMDTTKVPRIGNKGLVKLTVGDQLYTLFLAHKVRFNSIFRVTHSSFREAQLSFPADIVVTAHTHAPGLEIAPQYPLAREAGFDFGGQAIWIKVGSYQHSKYGQKYFHNEAICNPTVVLYPDRYKKVPFTDPHDAIDFIKHL